MSPHHLTVWGQKNLPTLEMLFKSNQKLREKIFGRHEKIEKIVSFHVVFSDWKNLFATGSYFYFSKGRPEILTFGFSVWPQKM